jgi:hypothetical protein
MTADERAELVLAFARVLYVNGQATEQTVSAAERFGRALGLPATIMPRWGELKLVAKGKDGTLIAQAQPILRAWKWSASHPRCGSSRISNRGPFHPMLRGD